MDQNFTIEDEIIDLEWCAKHGHQVPKGRNYRIRVDREHFVVDVECMTGREILQLAGKKPVERFQLRQRLRGGEVRTIGYDQKVCFTDPGIEKFKTMPLDQTEGESLRRDFTLLEEDVEYLNSLAFPWEAVSFRNQHWVFVHDYPLPEGYNVKTATAAIRITPGYPDAKLDMIYFNPPLNRLDRQPIKALTTMQLDGKTFQRWSRHRTQANPWRPGIDDISTHLPLVNYWLSDEFNKRPRHEVSA